MTGLTTLSSIMSAIDFKTLLRIEKAKSRSRLVNNNVSHHQPTNISNDLNKSRSSITCRSNDFHIHDDGDQRKNVKSKKESISNVVIEVPKSSDFPNGMNASMYC